MERGTLCTTQDLSNPHHHVLSAVPHCMQPYHVHIMASFMALPPDVIDSKGDGHIRSREILEARCKAET